MNDAPHEDVDPRVLLAAERTLLAWLRTGISLMGFGFALSRFGIFLERFVPVGPSPLGQTSTGQAHVSLWIGIALVAVGVTTNVVAAMEHLRLIRELKEGKKHWEAKPSSAVFIAATLAVVGIVGCLFLLRLRG